VHQLGAESRLPLLNSRQVLDGLRGTAAVLWMPGVAHPSQAGAVLRAAAHCRAVVGLSLSPGTSDLDQLRSEHNPNNFFHATRQAAEQVDHLAPFVLHVDEAPVERPAGPAFEAVRDHLSRCLDAGFTSIGIDLSTCEIQAAPDIAAGLLPQVLDLELGVVIRLLGGRQHSVARGAERVSLLVASLKTVGISADVILLPGIDELGQDAIALAETVAPMIAPSGVGLVDSSRASPDPERIERAFVRTLVAGNRLGKPSGDQIDPDRLEALAYMEAMNILSGRMTSGSAPRLARTLLRTP